MYTPCLSHFLCAAALHAIPLSHFTSSSHFCSPHLAPCAQVHQQAPCRIVFVLLLALVHPRGCCSRPYSCYVHRWFTLPTPHTDPRHTSLHSGAAAGHPQGAGRPQAQRQARGHRLQACMEHQVGGARAEKAGQEGSRAGAGRQKEWGSALGIRMINHRCRTRVVDRARLQACTVWSKCIGCVLL